MRDRSITVTREDDGAWRVHGTDIERMVVQTDWDNDEAIDYLQHRFARLKLEETLAKAGCGEGDEVRILGFAFTYETHAGDLADESPQWDESESEHPGEEEGETHVG